MGSRAHDLHHLQDDQVLLSRPAWADVVPAEEILGGDVTMREMQRRNRVLVVRRPGRHGLAVKRGPGVRAEIRNLALLRTIPGLSGVLPEVEDASPQADVLVLRVADDAVHLWAHQDRLRRFPVELGASVGRGLAALHGGTRGLPGDPRLDGPPLALSIHQPTVEDVRTLSAASHELIREMQGHDRLCRQLDALCEEWHPTCLVHDDVKWPNVVVTPRQGDAPDVRLIDWEHLRRGDPAWDVGSALAAYVGFWIDAVASGDAGTDLAARADATWASIESMQPAMAALWSAYLDEAGVHGVGSWALMRRSAALCAVRLLRSAFEEAEARDVLGFRASLTLQVAANILDDPLGAAETLLGLPSSTG